MTGNYGFVNFSKKEPEELIYRNLARPDIGTLVYTLGDYSSLTKDKIIDGNDNTYWAASAGGVANKWIKLYLPASYQISRIRFLQPNQVPKWLATKISVRTSFDLNDWTTIKDVDVSANFETNIYFEDPVSAQYWMIYALAGGGDKWLVSSIELWGNYSYSGDY